VRSIRWADKRSWAGTRRWVSRLGWIGRRESGWILAGLVVMVVIGGLATSVPRAHAAPAPASVPGSGLLGDGHGARDKDSRPGVASPTSTQRAVAGRFGTVRWNAFGTPYSLGPAKALASGLTADPTTAARQFLARNQALFGLNAAAVAMLDVLAVQPIGTASVVLLQQRFGDLPAGHDGLVSVLVQHGSVLRVTSSLARDTDAPAPATLSAADAVRAALRDAGLSAAQVGTPDVREVAVPMPGAAPRAAYQITLISSDTPEPAAYTSYVDARDGSVLVREDLVDFDSDNPTWAVFAATPPDPIDLSTDPRVIWCLSPTTDCVRTVHDPVSGQAWDVSLATGTPTFTSSGNSANNVVLWGAGTPAVPATTSPDRSYIYPFTDQWHQAKCDPAGFASAQRNDADAAVANLFAMHNRMHDWAYHLGFTEATWNMQTVNLGPDGLGGDAEQGRAQANALGGSRNNANQNTPRDGVPPATNMFLWQPVAGAAYPPCVDGDYDMTVIAHEFTHAITNRMIAGPNAGITGFQGGSMGEAWSDLTAAEYLFENNYHAPGNSPFVTGGYVTGDLNEGIRDYDASKSPLNYSDLGFDVVGPEVHADGEIWVATNLRVRAEFVKRYGRGTPALQLQCADGLVPVGSCPGNRRWAQLMFDSYLLQATSAVGMLDMRDNMLAADLARFGGANQDIIWNAFAESGMGDGASGGSADTDATASFASPYANNATVRLLPIGDSAGAVIRLYVGDYEARAVPIADTDPNTAIPDTFQVVPNRSLDFIATGVGYGHHKFNRAFQPGTSVTMGLDLPVNLASLASGATVSGDGVNLNRLADDTEATDWASLTGVAGEQVTIDLAGDQPQLVDTLNVSALLRPAITGDIDAGPQNRFTALRSFAVLACDATVADCTQDASYQTVFTSAPDAFPGGAFRPVAPQLILRTFTFGPVPATHLRIVVLSSQCTGNPSYAGEQDNDPAAQTDCATASPFAQQVRIAEVQAFTR
jgi:extracellular elastinolytic metalloproteinase